MRYNFKHTMRLFFIALILCVGLSGLAIAQEITGSINGTVRDASGAVVAGATVTISDPSKNDIVVRTLTTNDDGQFDAPSLQSGVYKVTVEAVNFKKSVNTDVKLDVGQRRSVDVALEAGNISETVTVQADPVAVELTTPTAGTTINGDQVRELSLNNRNWVQLVALAPGVTNDLADQVYTGTTNPEGQANTINISVNGARSSQNTFTVDGADVTDRGSNITIQAYPSVDSIGEFKVLRSLYPAESGRSGGGQVNVVTRSGGKRFSGSAYEFVRNEVFNANNFLINRSSSPPFGREDNGKARRPPFRYNDYGWTLGGPVYFFNFGEGDGGLFRRYDRTFFFFSEEFRKDRRSSAAATVTVPDQNLRNGIFPVPVCINRAYLGETCTAATTLAAGTPLPANLYSPSARAYLTQIYNNLPLPNLVTAASPYQLVTSLRNVSDFQQEIIKIDHSFSDKWSAFYRYERDQIPTIDGNALFSSGSGLPDVSTTSTNSPGRTHTFQTTYILNPRVILEGRYTYGYGAILSENIGALSLANSSIPVTLPFASSRDRVPTLTGNGFTGLTSFGPYDNFSYKKNYSGSLTWIFGNHTTKYGAMYSYYRKNENALVSGTAGSNEGTFNTFPSTVATGAANTTLNQNIQRWASFLVGNVSSGGFSQARYDYTADLRQNAFEAYAQDEWRMKRNLTLYMGVRYSYFPSPWDKNGHLTNFDPSLYNFAEAPGITGAGTRVANTGNFCTGMIVNEQNFTTGPATFNCRPAVSPYGKYVTKNPKTDFAPRVGIAWDPFGKGRTSIRSGYGIYHEQVLVGTYEQNIGANAPFQEVFTAPAATSLDNPAGALSFSLTPPSIRAVQANWETPYMQHWSLDWQQQLDDKTIVTVGYFGSKGTHLIGATEFNDIPPGKALNSNCINAANQVVKCQPAGYIFQNSTTAVGNPNGSTTDILILDQLRPFRGYRSIVMIEPKYNSKYASLQFSAQRRFTGASQVNLAYTWSKNLTDNQTDRSTAPQDTYNSRAEYARATLDRRHVFTVNYVYEIPLFAKQEGFTGKVLGGWQFSGITTYQTGLPFTVTTSNLDAAGTGLINANPAARPNLLCDPNENAPHTFEQWFNIACFQTNAQAVLSPSNTLGSAPRGIVQGPSTFRTDITMSKNIRFGETMRMQFRWEVYNVFNKTNLRGFSSLNVTSTAFGLIGSVRDPRTMQFGLKFYF